MKEKILPFIIGFLVGAIIMAGGFLIFQNNNKHQGPKGINGERPQMMQRQDGNSMDRNTQPSLPKWEKPNGEAHSKDSQTQNSSDTTSTTTNS